MKTFILAALFCFTFRLAAQEFVLKGKINNPVSTEVYINTYNRMGNQETITIKLDSNNNTFEYRNLLIDIAYIDFYHTDFTINSCADCHLKELIIEPGDEIHITFDTKKYWNSLTFEGKSAEKFRYYKEDHIETRIKKDWEQSLRKQANKPAKEYFSYIDNTITEKLSILKKYKNKVSPIYYAIKEADIKAQVGNLRMSVLYDTTTNDFRPIQALPYNIQTAFFKNLPKQNDTTAKAKHFFAYVTGLYYTYLSEFSQLTQNPELHKQVSIVRQNQVYFHPAFAERLSSSVILKDLNDHGINPTYQKNLEEFKTVYPNSAALQEIENMEVTKQDFIVGKPAKPFKVVGLNGNEVQLKDFAGKVVYLDFWASWCSPCIVDIANSKKVKEHFKGRNDILFLYISRDADETKWKAAIEKYKIEGVHGIATDDNPIGKDYAISMLPSYFVIGRDGNFHTIQPIRPIMNEGRGLIKILENALAQNITK